MVDVNVWKRSEAVTCWNSGETATELGKGLFNQQPTHRFQSGKGVSGCELGPSFRQTGEPVHIGLWTTRNADIEMERVLRVTDPG